MKKKMVSLMMTLALVFSMIATSPAAYALSLDDVVSTANADVDVDEVRESADQLHLSDVPIFSAGDILELQVLPAELAQPLGWEVKEVDFSDDSVFTVLDADDPEVIAYLEEQDAATSHATTTTSNPEGNTEQEAAASTEPENLSIFLKAHKKGQCKISVVLENPLYDGELELTTTATSYNRAPISNKLSQAFGYPALRPSIRPILPIAPTIPDFDNSTEDQQPGVTPTPPTEENNGSTQPNPDPIPTPNPNPNPNPNPELPSVNPVPPTNPPLPPIIINPSYPSRPSRPSRPSTPTNPSVPDVTDPDEPDTDNPGDSDGSDGTDDPSNPSNPENPSNPTNPGNPDDGSDPSKPGDSDSDSSKPGDSDGDGDGKPGDSDNPGNPSQPDPDNPGGDDGDIDDTDPDNPDPENPDPEQPDEPSGPITIDTSGWKVDTLSFVYDGKEHYPTIEGVPDNVKVNVTGGATTVGEYECTISYEVPEGYTPIDDMTFTYEITPATISVSQKYDFATGTVKPVLTGLVESDVQISTQVDNKDTDELDSSAPGIHRATTTVTIDESKQENYIIDRDLMVDTIYNVKSNTQWGYIDLQSTVENGKLTVKIMLNDLKIEQTKLASSMVSLDMKVHYDTSRLQYESFHVGTSWNNAENITDNPDAGYGHLSLRYGAFGGHPLATSSEVITLVYDLLDPTNDQDIIFNLGGIQLMPNVATANGDILDFKYYIGDVSFVVNPSKVNTDDIFIDRNPIEDTKYYGSSDPETSDAQHDRLEQYIKDNFDLPNNPDTSDPDESNPNPSNPDQSDPNNPNNPSDSEDSGNNNEGNEGNDSENPSNPANPDDSGNTDEGNGDSDKDDPDDGSSDNDGNIDDSNTGDTDNSGNTDNGDGDTIVNPGTPGDNDDDNTPGGSDGSGDNETGDSDNPATPSPENPDQPNSGSSQPGSSDSDADNGNAGQDNIIPALGDNIKEVDEEDAEDEGYTGRINDKATSNPAAIPEPPFEVPTNSSNDPEPQPNTGGSDDPGASTSTTNRVEPTAQSSSDDDIVATRSTSSDNGIVVDAI